MDHGRLSRRLLARRLLSHHLPAAVLCAFLLVLPGLLNGGPFLYFDSGLYLGQADKAVQMMERLLGLAGTGAEAGAAGGAPAPASDLLDDDGITAGRSIYYGLFAWAGGQALGLIGVAALQAAVLGGLIVMAVRIACPTVPPAVSAALALAIAAGLGLLTSAGLFVSLVMPDIWAGAMVLAFALLMAGRPALSGAARAALGAVMALAALFHTSHLLLLGAMIGLAALAALHPRWRHGLPWRSLAVPVAALACGLAGQAAFSLAVTKVTGDPPITMPHLTAHLVEMGPGTRMARDTCPESGFAICPYVDRLPTGWIEFLFSRDPDTGVFRAVPLAVRRALSEEQGRFALATLAAEPLATSGGLARDGVAQLWHLSVDDVPLTALSQRFLAANFAPDVAEAAQSSVIWNHPWIAPAMTRVIQASTAVAVAGLLALAVAGRLPRRGPPAALLLLCVGGLVLNALICGALASPYGRFQARVAWLLPLLLALTALAIRFSGPLPAEDGARDPA